MIELSLRAFALLAVCAGLSVVRAASAAGLPAPPEPVVRTVAGTGESGMVDGPAGGSSFMEPDGIAVGQDGTLYVADGLANDVRAVANGSVHAVAGSPEGSAGLRDGPSATALFHRPVGVAVAKDGTLYVADSLNFCIRRISGGVVTTFAGKASRGKTDGVGPAASFWLPKGIALDDDGNLYVADFDVGIRKITPDGAVTTLSVPTTGKVFSVAARGSGANVILDYTDDEGMHIFSGGNHRALANDTEREPYSQDNHVGHAFGVAIVDKDSMVVTDLWTNAVRYVNFNDPPFRPAAKTRTLAGGKRDGALVIGGFRDGATEVAMVKSPYGIAYASDGRIVVADSGNRRIREIDGLDPRLPVASNSSNLVFPPHAYRIALVANSLTWNDVLWPESMSGILESGLAANQNALGTTLVPSVANVSVSAATFHSASSYIAAHFGDGQADLVIYEYDKSALAHEFDVTPALRDGSWKTVLPAQFRDLAAQLAKRGTKFALLLLPRPRDISPVENAAIREYINEPDVFTDADNYRSALEFENVFAQGQPHAIRMLGPLADLERGPDTTPLYNTFDNHFTVHGSFVVGQALVADLLAWKPWAGVTPRP